MTMTMVVGICPNEKVWEYDSDDDDNDAILRHYSENPSDLRAALVQLLQREVNHDKDSYHLFSTLADHHKDSY